ncbi:neprosin family prolyl endopeptidase [Actinoplanes sp. NPDC026623]|uniref:neprosin family prolyl endopeptidase n=1 Tax=Actinoplanes sp. NPDC026623 TaxID=3155610 RepID=UPI0033DA48A5
MGVAWTLSANADETSEVEIPAVTAAAADPGFTPPPLLPWGERPHKTRRGKAGASSAALAAAGADAAPADTSGSLVPRPEFAPKGRTSQDSVLRSMKTTLVPPNPPALAPAPTPTSSSGPLTARFEYAGGRQSAETDGNYANLPIYKPELARGDYHTLVELAVQSADGRQIIEVGWNVDRFINKGSADPHLFVYYWVDKKAQCYNCDFTSLYPTSVKPGDTLPVEPPDEEGHPVGAARRFAIQHFGGAWWIAYETEWIGYFPDSLWDGKFTKVGLTQWFGEIATSAPLGETTCTDMGNGLKPLPPPPPPKEGDPPPPPLPKDYAARVGSINHTNGPPLVIEYPDTSNTNPKYYPSQPVSDRTFRYGGPGTGPC